VLEVPPFSAENDRGDQSLRCEPSAFSDTKDVPAHDALLMAVVEYFRSGSSLDSEEKVIQTRLPPIYLQHQGDYLVILDCVRNCAKYSIFDV